MGFSGPCFKSFYVVIHLLQTATCIFGKTVVVYGCIVGILKASTGKILLNVVNI